MTDWARSRKGLKFMRNSPSPPTPLSIEETWERATHQYNACAAEGARYVMGSMASWRLSEGGGDSH